MKLYNTVVVWDVYVVAESEEKALEATRMHIRQEGLRASEEVALETRDPKNIRRAWETERPLVAADVSDKNFETLKGKTTTDVFAMLHTKQEPKAVAK